MDTKYKVIQEIYHRLNPIVGDEMYNFNVEISEDIINNAVRYFVETEIGFIYPSKSYVVGICYAKWLSEKYGGRPLEYLDDQELLYNNDPYFKKYSADPASYIHILEKVGGWDFDETKGIIPDIKKYFDEEFSYTE